MVRSIEGQASPTKNTLGFMDTLISISTNSFHDVSTNSSYGLSTTNWNCVSLKAPYYLRNSCNPSWYASKHLERSWYLFCYRNGAYSSILITTKPTDAFFLYKYLFQIVYLLIGSSGYSSVGAHYIYAHIRVFLFHSAKIIFLPLLQIHNS